VDRAGKFTRSSEGKRKILGVEVENQGPLVTKLSLEMVPVAPVFGWTYNKLTGAPSVYR
jgi:hypothetical protein